MSRSEIYVDSANADPHSKLYDWLNERGVPFRGMFEELSRIHVSPFEEPTATFLVEGEEVTLKTLRLIGNGGYSVHLSVGDGNEVKLIEQGLIPS